MANLVGGENTQKAFGWAARDSSGILSPFNFSRRVNGDNDVTLKILYCGICHSDLYSVQNDFGRCSYPLAPGHEIIGVLTHVGRNVTKLKVGDKLGVGCLVGSCRACKSCKQDLEHQCPNVEVIHNVMDDFGPRNLVVDHHFAVRLPDNQPSLEGVGPLLCAGITVYSPMKYFDLCKPGMSLGVVGLGGLGHLALKFAKAFGMEVISVDYVNTAMERLARGDVRCRFVIDIANTLKP